MKRGQEHKSILNKKVIDNRWMNITPFARDSVTQWTHDMNVDVVRNVKNTIIGLTNYDPLIEPYDVGGIKGIINIVPEFDLLGEVYQNILHNHFHFRYFEPLCSELLNIGYEPKESLFGLPYDPRLLLDKQYRITFFQLLQDTIERGVDKYSEKAIVVTHSLGGVLLKWFLTTHVSRHWISRNMGKLYIVNAPFGGTTMALRVILSGEYYVPMFHQQFKEPLQRMSGIIMCLPNAYAYGPDEDLVRIDDTQTSLRIQDFHAIHSDNIAFEMWRDLYHPHLKTIMKPFDVDMPCEILTSGNNETMNHFKIRKEGELPYACKYEPGDGQVPRRSLDVAQQLFIGPRCTFTDIHLSNHIDIVSHPLFIQKILKEASTGACVR